MTASTHVVITPGTGTAPPVVLVHGVGLNHTMWADTTEFLASRPDGPATVVAYDLIGHGRSDNPPGPRRFDDFVDQLNRVVDENCETSPNLVGLSLGGAIVRGTAARNPDRYGRVAIVSAVFQRGEDQRAGALQRLRLAADQGMDPITDLAIARWFTPQWRQANPEPVAVVDKMLRAADLDGYLKAYRVFVDGDPDMPDRIADITNPTLVCAGDRDTGSTPAMTTAMAGAIPHARSSILADCGHLPPIEHPELFNRLLADFFETQDHGDDR